MAFVHPSRAGLIPTDTRRDDPLTPPRQNYRDNRDRDGHDSRPRRSSPSYNDFSGRQPPPPEGRNENPPWRNGNENNMYPQRDGGRPVDTNSYRPPPGGGGYRGGGGSSQGWLESRRQQRESSAKSIWPPSPKAPSRDDSPHPKSKRSSKKHKRSRSSDSDDSNSGSDSDSDDRHKRRKHSSKHRDRRRDDPHRSSKHSSHSKHRRSSRRDRYSDDASDASDNSRKDSRRQKDRTISKERRNRSRSHSKSSPRADSRRSPSPQSRTPAEEAEWIEAASETALGQEIAGAAAPASPIRQSHPEPSSSSVPGIPHPQQSYNNQPDDGDDEEVGPQPLVVASDKIDERTYGGALLRGEGSAMAAFIQNNERIPRRGEIGLSSDQIEKYEESGYVMSGSRHRRMNAVRMRKENQVISAEEKRGILKLQKEEQEKREQLIVGGFKEILEDKLKAAGKK